jgi:hypothetical protein
MRKQVLLGNEYKPRADKWDDDGTECTVEIAYVRSFRTNRNSRHQPKFAVGLCRDVDHTFAVRDNFASNHAVHLVKRDHVRPDARGKCHCAGGPTQHRHAEFGYSRHDARTGKFRECAAQQHPGALGNRGPDRLADAINPAAIDATQYEPGRAASRTAERRGPAERTTQPGTRRRRFAQRAATHRNRSDARATQRQAGDQRELLDFRRDGGATLGAVERASR